MVRKCWDIEEPRLATEVAIVVTGGIEREARTGDRPPLG